MNILGYKTLHDDEAPAVTDLYGALYRHEITEDELHEKLGERGFNCSFMYSGYQWAAAQENVKVILTTRDDPAKWVDSWLVVADVVDILARPPFIWSRRVRDIMPVLIDIHKNIPSGGHPDQFLDRDVLLKGYQTHLTNVRQAVPSERLLEYNVKQGWGPLCEFLEVPIPNVPFPHINDRIKMRAFSMALRIITWIWPVVIVFPLLLIYWFVTGILSKSRPEKIKRS